MVDVNTNSSGGDLSTFSKFRNQILSAIEQAIRSATASIVTAISGAKSAGTFTLAVAATTTVTDANTGSLSVITLMPTNAAAATLMGSAKSLYVSARTAGTSFTDATADASAAAGTETFSYSIYNPS